MNEEKKEPKFPIGSVVRLKSGGPLMTVVCHPYEDTANVIWFEGRIERANVEEVALEARN